MNERATGNGGRTRVVVLVDNDLTRVDALSVDLDAYGYAPIACAPIDMAEDLRRMPAAVVLGPGLLPVEAFDLCHEVRRYTDSPLFVLMPGRGPRQMSLALESGADHCFLVESHDAAPLLVSALHSVERREEMARRQRRANLMVGQIHIDLDRRTADLQGSPVPLTLTEFNILALLARNAGKVMSATEILECLQDDPVGNQEARDIVKVHVSRLRQKLEVDPTAAQTIVNVRGQGYVLDRRGGARSGDRPGADSPSSKGAEGAPAELAALGERQPGTETRALHG